MYERMPVLVQFRPSNGFVQDGNGMLRLVSNFYEAYQKGSTTSSTCWITPNKRGNTTKVDLR